RVTARRTACGPNLVRAAGYSGAALVLVQLRLPALPAAGVLRRRADRPNGDRKPLAQYAIDAPGARGGAVLPGHLGGSGGLQDVGAASRPDGPADRHDGRPRSTRTVRSHPVQADGVARRDLLRLLPDPVPDHGAGDQIPDRRPPIRPVGLAGLRG